MNELFTYYRPLFYLFFFAVLVVFTILINKILLKFSTNLGIRNPENAVRWTTSVKPALGGISFYLMMILVSLGFLAYFPVESFQRFEVLVFILVCTLGFMMGLADDAYNTKPILKFLVQFLCAFLFIYSDNYIKVSPWDSINYMLTVLWVVGLMNSVNMLDNMDGVTSVSSLGILIGMAFLGILNQSTDSFWFAVALGVAASLTGFLYHNWFPAKMYMGDSGSQFLGVFLAWLGVKFLWNGLDNYGEPVQAKQVIWAATFFLGPISDTTTVTLNRIMKGKSPFVGGRDHTTHCLVYNGLAQRHVAFVFLAIPLLSAFLGGIWVNFSKPWDVLQTILAALYFFVVLVSLYWTTKTRLAKAKMM